MFPDPIVTIAIFVFAMISAGGVAYVFIYPLLSGEKKAEGRVTKVTDARANKRGELRAGNDPTARRKQVEETLKEIEEKQKRITKNPPLSVRIQQAGLSWTKNTFYMVSLVAGLVGFIAALFLSNQILVAIGVGFAMAFGFPNWFLNSAKQRRLTKFVAEFPNAVDVIVRGVKAGLPLADCIRICAQESQEPVKTEFKSIVETQALGISLADAVERLYERVPIPEANFFAIVVSVQQRSGGNLSEILGNLSKVLRDRKKMKMKVIALSQEAKASAAIIAALPLVVMILVYMSAPDYISMLWTTSTGQFLLMCSAGWMFLGVLVMRKMINFDF